MKQNFTLVFTVIFIAVAVWLSFAVKHSKKQLAAVEYNLKVLNREHSQAKYQLDLIQEVLELNFNVPVSLVDMKLPQTTNDASGFPVLYLKSNACSPCNLPVIKGIVKHLHSTQDFLIISHPSNRHFLSQVLEEESVPEEERVIWLETPLYEGDNGYDSELLFVDHLNRKVGCLPFELLKEKSLFDKILKNS